MIWSVGYTDQGQIFGLEVDSKEQAKQLARLLPDGAVLGPVLAVEKLDPALDAFVTVRQALHRIGSTS